MKALNLSKYVALKYVKHDHASIPPDSRATWLGDHALSLVSVQSEVNYIMNLLRYAKDSSKGIL